MDENGIVEGKEYIFVPRPDAKPHVQAYHGRTVTPRRNLSFNEGPDEYTVNLDGPMLAFADEMVDPEV